MTRPLVINLRGTNGSGKSTLARGWIKSDSRLVNLVDYPSPTKREPDRRHYVTGRGDPERNVIVVGSYDTACGGLDGIANFDRQQRAIVRALGVATRVDPPHSLGRTVICEGVLSSTVYGSWEIFDRSMQALGRDFAWTYLHTPLDVCLERIAQRQRAAGREREIKVALVADKVRAIARTRERALADGRLVYDLPYGGEHEALDAIVRREGEAYRAR